MQILRAEHQTTSLEGDDGEINRKVSRLRSNVMQLKLWKKNPGLSYIDAVAQRDWFVLRADFAEL